MGTAKAVPILLRDSAGTCEILVFGHPLGGVQFVKGTIEPGESAEEAAIRELAEESGLVGATCTRNLGAWASGYEDQLWFLVEVRIAGILRETWEYFTQDGGGHIFQFFWHPLHAAPTPDWHPVFRAALGIVRERVDP